MFISWLSLLADASLAAVIDTNWGRVAPWSQYGCLAKLLLDCPLPSFHNQAQKMYKRNFLPLFDIDREKGSQGTKVMICWSRIVFPKERWWWCSSLPTAFSYSSSWTHPGSPMIKQSIIIHILKKWIVCDTKGSQQGKLVLEQSQVIILAKVIWQHIHIFLILWGLHMFGIQRQRQCDVFDLHIDIWYLTQKSFGQNRIYSKKFKMLTFTLFG